MLAGTISFWRNQWGQDVVEYSLLLAFVCVASAAIFVNLGFQTIGIWSRANSLVSTANSAAVS